ERAAVVGEIELLLRHRRHQQSHPVELFGVQNVFEQTIEIVGGDELALRDVAEVGARRQEDRRWEFGQEVLGEVEIEVETLEITARLSEDVLDVRRRKQHSAFGMLRMR